MIDHLEALRLALTDLGETATISGHQIACLPDIPPPEGAPYRDDSGETAPHLLALQEDLSAAGLWPLTATELTVRTQSWRIVRVHNDRGEVTIIMRENT